MYFISHIDKPESNKFQVQQFMFTMSVNINLVQQSQLLIQNLGGVRFPTYIPNYMYTDSELQVLSQSTASLTSMFHMILIHVHLFNITHNGFSSQ